MNFNDLINANKNNVRSIIRLITKQDNEDLEQEVYIKVWKNVDKYEERGSFKSWINTVAKNVSKDYLKSAGYRNSINTTSDEYTLDCIKDNKKSAEAQVIGSERQKRIRSPQFPTTISLGF